MLASSAISSASVAGVLQTLVGERTSWLSSGGDDGDSLTGGREPLSRISDTMADHTTTLPTLIDTSHRPRSTVAQLVDIPEEAARRW
jgi:hypothetical protein